MDNEAQVARIAQAALAGHVTVAVAESLTCGALVNTLGLGEQSATWLAGAVVAYQTGVKVDVLGLDPDVDPCSAECAVQLAVGVRELLGADVAVAATGVGGPDPEDGHEPGTVYIGWAREAEHGHRGFDFTGDPAEVLEQTVGAALGALEGILGTVLSSERPREA